MIFQQRHVTAKLLSTSPGAAILDNYVRPPFSSAPFSVRFEKAIQLRARGPTRHKRQLGCCERQLASEIATLCRSLNPRSQVCVRVHTISEGALEANTGVSVTCESAAMKGQRERECEDVSLAVFRETPQMCSPCK